MAPVRPTPLRRRVVALPRASNSSSGWRRAGTPARPGRVIVLPSSPFEAPKNWGAPPLALLLARCLIGRQARVGGLLASRPRGRPLVEPCGRWTSPGIAPAACEAARAAPGCPSWSKITIGRDDGVRQRALVRRQALGSHLARDGSTSAGAFSVIFSPERRLQPPERHKRTWENGFNSQVIQGMLNLVFGRQKPGGLPCRYGRD